jgi:hypothetical protein
MPFKKGAKILVQEDKDQEEELFLKFLNHPEFPQHGQMILRVFPSLKSIMETSENEEKAVRKFVDKFYLDNKTAISLAIQESKKEMKPSPKAISALGKAMDYSWPSNTTYIAIPTILPFSPFNKNVFYFSILDRIMNKGRRNVLTTAIHEISHFIFFDFLEKIEKKERISLSAEPKYYLREALTVALFNEEPLKFVLGIENYAGNPEIHDIYVINKSGLAIGFVNYIREQYLISIRESIKFEEFLTDLIMVINKVSDDFSKRRLIWNSFGKELLNNQIEFEKYKKPIKLF